MGGQRNGRFIRYFIAVVGLFVSVYILYGYSQAHNQLKMKNNYLSIAEDEYKALSRRFDMLSSELKNTVQISADLEKQLRNSKNSHTQTVREKEEQERQCKTEYSRKENEKAQLDKEKLQLTEEKDQFKRERDRLSSQFDSLTQECSDARDTATNVEQQLRDDCDARVKECGAANMAQSNELANCKVTLEEANNNLFHCNREVSSARSTSKQCQSELSRLEKESARLMEEQEQQRHQYHQNQPQQEQQIQQQQQQQQQQKQRFHPISDNQDNQRYDPVRGQKSVFGKNKNLDHYSFQNPADSKYQREPAPNYKEMAGDGVGGGGGGGGGGVGDFHQNYQDNRDGKEPLSQHPMGADARGGGGGGDEGGNRQITLGDKKAVYQSLKEKLNRGEVLDERKSRLFRSLSKLFEKDNSSPQEMERNNVRAAPSLPGGNDVRGQEVHVPSQHGGNNKHEVQDGRLDRQEVNVPSLPGNNNEQKVHVPSVPGNNNEQEEVKDLVDSQQKVDANVAGAGKTRGGRAGGGGGPGEEHAVVDGDPLPEREARGDPLPDRRNLGAKVDPGGIAAVDPANHDHRDNNDNPAPLEKPVREQVDDDGDDDPVVNEEGEEDDDVNDYGRGADPKAGQMERENEVGHKAFMEDQRLFDEERRMLHRRANDKENDVVRERDPLAGGRGGGGGGGQLPLHHLADSRNNPVAQNPEMK